MTGCIEYDLSEAKRNISKPDTVHVCQKIEEFMKTSK